jgi:Uma2 family endonuclease
MTIATQNTHQKDTQKDTQKGTQNRMTLEEYLAYDDGTDVRYELVDGVLVEMGAENPLNPKIASFLFSVLLGLGVPYSRIIIGHQIGVSSTKATARQPDLIVHTDESDAAIMKDGKILRAGFPAPMLVVEVVSNSAKDKKSRDRDYQEKPLEYAERGIPEYWIIDPDQAMVKIGTLINGTYQFADFTGAALIVSPTFPTLKLTAAQVLKAGE